MKSPPVSDGSLRGTKPRIGRYHPVHAGGRADPARRSASRAVLAARPDRADGRRAGDDHGEHVPADRAGARHTRARHPTPARPRRARARPRRPRRPRQHRAPSPCRASVAPGPGPGAAGRHARRSGRAQGRGRQQRRPRPPRLHDLPRRPAPAQRVVAREGLLGLPVTLAGLTRHNRKRRPRPKTTAPQVPPRAPARARPRIEDRPKPPWHPVPLVEIAVLVGIVCIVVGFIKGNTTQGRTLIVLGFALGSLGGLDTSIREHFAGYRAHTLVLALAPAVALTVLLAVAGLTPALIAPIGVAIGGVAFLLLRGAWARTQAPPQRQ